MKKLLIFILIIVMLGIFSFIRQAIAPVHEGITKVSIGDAVIKVSLAATPAERERGLSGTEALADGEGMLFVFDHSDLYGFWMKDMNYALDIIYIGENLAVTDIITADPSTYPEIFYPKIASKYVLEVKAAAALKNIWRVGNLVKFLP